MDFCVTCCGCVASCCGSDADERRPRRLGLLEESDDPPMWSSASSADPFQTHPLAITVVAIVVLQDRARVRRAIVNLIIIATRRVYKSITSLVRLLVTIIWSFSMLTWGVVMTLSSVPSRHFLLIAVLLPRRAGFAPEEEDRVLKVDPNCVFFLGASKSP